MCYGIDATPALSRSLAQRGTDRRTFLRGALALGAGAGIAAGSAVPAMAAPGGRRVAHGLISIQLYTLRAAMTDWPTAKVMLRKLSRKGYRRVELAGLYGQDAATVRKYLGQQGIWASSSHVGISADAAALEQKLADAETLRHDYINVPYLNSAVGDDWRRWADQMNVEAAAAAEHGIRYGYHNHAHEFTIVLEDGSSPWDVLTERLDPSLVHLEVDLYWAVTGGIGVGAADPIQFANDVVNAGPQEVLQYHVKDRHADDSATPGDMADLGTGTIDFARIFANHRVDEYIVENDTPDVTPLQTAKVGYNYLRDLRF